ncbi:hypothetical protein [Propionivibrio sp.]|uniref:hypothetical protein n=1 Tax=Propionivibrio sp. TaxID=2212460 RepID=UPI003BF3A165
MTVIYRCPKCDARFDPPRAEESDCPRCGIWFHKWNVVAEALPPEEIHPLVVPAEAPDSLSYYGRAIALVFVALWGIRLAAMDYGEGEIGGSFMHNIVLPIHEAGHVFFMPFGEFLAILGGSLFQVALPLGIGAAFLWRQRDAFGAAICLWWAGASLVDVAPYIWDSLNPQLILLGGHTGEDGPHDWIYLLGRLGAIKNAHAWGATAHHIGTLMMIAGVLWGGRWLWRWRGVIKPGSSN